MMIIENRENDESNARFEDLDVKDVFKYDSAGYILEHGMWFMKIPEMRTYDSIHVNTICLSTGMLYRIEPSSKVFRDPKAELNVHY